MCELILDNYQLYKFKVCWLVCFSVGGILIMSENKFIEELVELMDTEEELTMDSVLSDIDEWDSLSYVAFLAMAAANSEKRIAPQAVKSAVLVRDLYELAFGE